MQHKISIATNLYISRENGIMQHPRIYICTSYQNCWKNESEFDQFHYLLKKIYIYIKFYLYSN